MGVMGHYFHRVLGDLGYRVECSIVPDQPPALQMIPLPAARSMATLRGLRGDETRVYFDRCLTQVVPIESPGVTNVVFLHGLRYAPGLLLHGQGIAGLCANSDHLRRVLLGLMLHPELEPELDSGRPRFAFQGDALVGSVPLVLPSIEYPAGYPSFGEALPDSIRAELDRDHWLGHALRPRKLDPLATAAILHLLGQEPLRSALGRPVRLLVSDVDANRVVDAARRAFGTDEVSRVLVPVPWINNAELVEVMRRSHFALLHDWFPEPFGLYPLESVFHGCPVYTSGAGNLRHLLPPGHGIRVEDAGITGGPAARYQAIAASIADGLVSRSGAADCEKGRAFICRRHTVDAFREGLGAFLDRVEQRPECTALDPHALVIEVSPSVRAIHGEVDGGARILSDLGELRLDASEHHLVQRVTGTSLDTALRDLDAAERSLLSTLFGLGAVSLGANLPDPSRIHLPPP
jgi:hypothetical protein